MEADPHQTFFLSTPSLTLGEGRGEGLRAMPKNEETPAPIYRKRSRKGFRGPRTEVVTPKTAAQA